MLPPPSTRFAGGGEVLAAQSVHDGGETQVFPESEHSQSYPLTVPESHLEGEASPERYPLQVAGRQAELPAPLALQLVSQGVQTPREASEIEREVAGNEWNEVTLPPAHPPACLRFA